MNILNFKKIKFIYILSKLVFESLAHKIDTQFCFFLITNLCFAGPSGRAV